MDLIQQKFGKVSWRYATGDLSALEELEARMAAVGRNRSLITYSERKPPMILRHFRSFISEYHPLPRPVGQLSNSGQARTP